MIVERGEADAPFDDQRVRKAASLAIDRQALSDADTLGASKPNGNVVLKRFEYALPIKSDPYDPVQAKKLLAEAGYPNGFDAGDLIPVPPYFATGEAITGYLGAVESAARSAKGPASQAAAVAMTAARRSVIIGSTLAPEGPADPALSVSVVD